MPIWILIIVILSGGTLLYWTNSITDKTKAQKGLIVSVLITQFFIFLLILSIFASERYLLCLIYGEYSCSESFRFLDLDRYLYFGYAFPYIFWFTILGFIASGLLLKNYLRSFSDKPKDKKGSDEGIKNRYKITNAQPDGKPLPLDEDDETLRRYKRANREPLDEDEKD